MTIYKDYTRAAMIYMIHMECDTSSACYKMTDAELVSAFTQIFPGKQVDH